MKYLKSALLALLLVLLVSAEAITFASGSTQYSVVLPDNLLGAPAVAADGSYRFALMDPDQALYDYTITAKVGSKTADVVDLGMGLYMIEHVTGNVRISVSRQRKTFAVSVSGNGAQWVEAAALAAAGEVFRFYADPEKVHITILVGGVPYQTASGADGTFVVLGCDVKSGIEIVAEKILPMLDVTFVGSGAEDAAGSRQVGEGESYRFSLTRRDGFTYRITATMNGTSVSVKEAENGTYFIETVTAPLTISVARTANTTAVAAPTKPAEPIEPTEPELPEEPGEPAPQEPEDAPVTEEKPPENKEPAQKPVLPDVTTGSFEPQEESFSFPWLIVVSTAGAAALIALFALRANRRTVSFVTNGGPGVRMQRVYRGRCASRPAEPRRADAVFAGWFTDEACTKRWIFEEYRVEEHTTLYAKWL